MQIAVGDQRCTGPLSLPVAAATPPPWPGQGWLGQLSCPWAVLGQKHCSRDTHLLTSRILYLNWYFLFPSGFCHQTWNRWAFIQPTSEPSTGLRASGCFLGCSQGMAGGGGAPQTWHELGPRLQTVKGAKTQRGKQG